MDDDVTVGKFYATFLIQDYFRFSTFVMTVIQNYSGGLRRRRRTRL